jgi:hypothetical protein
MLETLAFLVMLAGVPWALWLIRSATRRPEETA